MEFKRCIREESACWTISGSMDDDSYLNLESMIMNSQDTGKDIELDVSSLQDISMTGVKGLVEISKRIRSQGRSIRVVGATDDIRKKLEILDIL